MLCYKNRICPFNSFWASSFESTCDLILRSQCYMKLTQILWSYNTLLGRLSFDSLPQIPTSG